MGIATLIAAGRLDDRMIAWIREALALVDVECGEHAWIDEGDAADLRFDGEPARVRAVLSAIEHIDFAVRDGGRVPPGLFVADMDSTIIGQECIDELADYAGFKHEVAAITERAMQGELDFASALTERVRLLEGLESTVIADCLAERIRPNPGAATLIGTLNGKGVRTLLVSGGFTDFVHPIGTLLGFDRMLANRLEAEGGKLTGRTVGDIVDADAKRRFAEENLAQIDSTSAAMVAIGDGANDVPMVALAGLGIGYRPKPALARVADGLIRVHDLTAALWMLGIPRREWVPR